MVYRIIRAIFKGIFFLLALPFRQEQAEKAPPRAVQKSNSKIEVDDARWEKLEQETKTMPVKTAARARASSATRLPRAKGQMPQLTPRPIPLRSNTPPKPFSEAAQREAVKLNLGTQTPSSGLHKVPPHGPGVRSGSRAAVAAVDSSGVRMVRDPANFARGQTLYVTIPEANEVFEAQIMNVGATELMLSLTIEDVLAVSLRKGQAVIIYLPTQSSNEYAYDAIVSNSSGAHTSWFSVRYDAMRLRNKRRTQRFDVNQRLFFRVASGKESAARGATAGAQKSGVSAATQGMLHDIGRGGFCVLTKTKIDVGACVFQIPGEDSQRISELQLVGEVLHARQNDDETTQKDWPFSIHFKMLRASRKLDELLDVLASV